MDITSKINELSDSLEKMNNQYINKKNDEKNLLERKEKIENEINNLKLTDIKKVSIVLDKMSKTQRETACKRLEELGTAALQYSLKENLEMKIYLPESKGNSKPKAEVKIRDMDTNDESDPLEANGGGIVDIISLALRLIIMQNHEPFVDGPLIMDEPFKMVSKEYIPALSEFIKNISKDFGRQLIMVTHNEYLAAMTDSKIYVKMDDNKISVAEVVTDSYK